MNKPEYLSDEEWAEIEAKNQAKLAAEAAEFKAYIKEARIRANRMWSRIHNERAKVLLVAMSHALDDQTRGMTLVIESIEATTSG